MNDQKLPERSGKKRQCCKEGSEGRRNHRSTPVFLSYEPRHWRKLWRISMPCFPNIFIKPQHIKPRTSTHPIKTRHRQNQNCEAFHFTCVKTSKTAQYRPVSSANPMGRLPFLMVQDMFYILQFICMKHSSSSLVCSGVFKPAPFPN